MVHGYGGASGTTPKTTLGTFRRTPCSRAANANTKTIAYAVLGTHTGYFALIFENSVDGLLRQQLNTKS